MLVPMARRHSFEEAREFAGVVAGSARSRPSGARDDKKMDTRQKRRGVLVDANQNGPGKTNATALLGQAACRSAGVTPLRWEEVVPGLDPAAFTMEVVLDRVAHARRSRRGCARRQAVAEGCTQDAELTDCSVAQALRMSEHRELDDVAPEERATVQSATTRSFRVKSGSW